MKCNIGRFCVLSICKRCVAVLGVLPITLAAAGAPPSDDLPDLSAVRAMVYSAEYPAAVAELETLSQQVQHAEVFNLLGYSLRQLRRYDEAASAYQQALLFDPAHRPALEYQGELYIATGDLARARQNLRYLELLCGKEGCLEHRLLQQAIDRAASLIQPRPTHTHQHRVPSGGLERSDQPPAHQTTQ
ncbi:tetratricopeptide repeat protein [Aquabacterium sp. A08]|uniref:tetratricopeptide repeat protein n=1 Tax=Aquabacterium sp. A08 TaxID=2718532 RepID=UPI0014233E78|nr:tetratricopeptide repeat protein [Aquabacterium sp. A08]NIC43767.1 tetratricopeptide repeat protein [Aquabacterium sp. A08]